MLAMMQRVVNESRNAVRGLRAPTLNSDDLETALSRVRARDKLDLQVTPPGGQPFTALVVDHATG